MPRLRLLMDGRNEPVVATRGQRVDGCKVPRVGKSVMGDYPFHRQWTRSISAFGSFLCNDRNYGRVGVWAT